MEPIHARKISKKRKIQKIGYFMGLMFLALMVICSVHLLRWHKAGSILIGDESYLQMDITKDIDAKDLLVPSSYGRWQINPYNLLLDAFSKVTSDAFASRMLPLVFGLMSLFFAYIVLRKCRFTETTLFFILVVLIISPPFIYTFSTSNIFSMLIFLNILVIYLVSKTNTFWQYLAIPIGILIFCFGWLSTITTILFLLIFTYMKQKERGTLFLIIFIALLSLGYVLSPYNTSNQHANTEDRDVSGIFKNLVSDLGSPFGFGIFDLLLLFVGIIVTWKMRSRYFPIYILLLILFFLALGASYEINIYIYIISAIFIGIGFISIINMDWNLKLVGELTIFIIACGLVFSSLAYVNRITESDPSKEMYEALSFLKGQEPGTVLSHQSIGIWIESIGGKNALTTSVPSKNRLAMQNALDDSAKIFASRDIEVVLSLMRKHDIKYLFIDSKMKNGLVWSREEEEGMLFLLRNSEIFKDIFKNNKVEIYKINDI
ncbi:hypothetical protein COV93_03735 [Candidatus Woesearchaeota archaeon CG11_big_fil_rev_8_21_14_0_20_43_8]|nr:MAG: hypothetical protein COV93_03735 [Candidatus Woesearchaeota archaeon CG11_big_fil_rev_8_21_14_0_20_43_8]